MSGNFQSDMFVQAVQIRTLSTASNVSADPTYATAQTILGSWEKKRRRVADGNGGFALAEADVLITSGQISGGTTYLTPTRDDLYFDLGSDATNENNGWRPISVDVFYDPDAAAGTVHHYEVTR